MSTPTSKTLGCAFWFLLGVSFLSAAGIGARRADLPYFKLLVWTSLAAAASAVLWLIVKATQLARRARVRAASARATPGQRFPTRVCQVCWTAPPVAYCRIHGVLLCQKCGADHVQRCEARDTALISLEQPAAAAR